MSLDLSVIIPAFNEEHRIPPTLRAYAEFLAGTSFDHEIVVVDDGSTDCTAAVVQDLARSLSAVRLVSSAENRGKGRAVRTGMLDARGRVRLMSDADGLTQPQEIPKIIAPILSGECAVAIGSRYLPGAVIETPQKAYRRIWSRAAHFIVKSALLPGIVDTHCGFKAFSEDAAKLLFEESTVDGWAFDLEILALAQARGLPIREIAVRWSNDGRSRARISHAVRCIADLVEIRRRMKRAKA